MDHLRKLQKDVANDVCTNMMVENSLKNDIKQTLNKRLEADELTKLRNEALEHFHKVLAASMEELYNEEKLESKLEELRQLKKDQQRFCTEDTKKGWRPSGNVNQDIKGPRCNALLAHMEDLEDIRNDLEQQIATKRTQLQEYIKQINQRMAS
uniref:Uncharacterized protein n=1 Tax=Ditylenchus dipsaci TaxID=166011 RepID=A0A915CMY4_9BILA